MNVKTAMLATTFIFGSLVFSAVQAQAYVYTASFNKDGTLIGTSNLVSKAAVQEMAANGMGGKYTVTFSTPFSSVPSCVYTPDVASTESGAQASDLGNSLNTSGVTIMTSSAGYPTSYPFTIKCNGPR